jgi:uridine kinase
MRVLSEESVVLVQQDHYYRDLGHLPFQVRAHQNCNHPDSIDAPLMIEHIRRLRLGRAIDRPVYDFTCHAREPQVVRLDPRPTIVVDGTLIFENKALCEMMDIKVFVDTDADIRLIRRLRRDICEHGGTAESVIEQYLATVRPMHMQFVEPFKQHADVIIPHGSSYSAGIDLVIREIRYRARLGALTSVGPQTLWRAVKQLHG